MVLILPFAGTQLAFNVYLRTFAEVFACNLGQLAEDNHRMPFRDFFLLASGFISP